MKSTLRIDEHWWVVQVADTSEMDVGVEGDCSHDDRVIRVRFGGGALVHEIIHAACPDLAEEAVLRLEQALLEVPRVQAELGKV